MSNDSIKHNLGTRAVKKLSQPNFPNADATLRLIAPRRSPEAIDVLLVNPPRPTALSGSGRSTGWAAVRGKT